MPHRPYLQLLLILAAWLFCQPLVASASEHYSERLNLSPYMQVLADPQGQFSIESVTAPELDTQFVTNDQKVFQAGFDSVPHWFRITLPPRNSFPEGDQHWHLWLMSPLLDEVDFYLPDGAGGWVVTHSGDTLPFSTRVIQHRDFVQPVNLQPDAPTTAYMYISTQGPMDVPLYLVSDHYLWQENQTELVVRSAFYGLMLGMLLYNLLVFFAIRDRLYFFYVMTILFGGLVTPLSMDGLGVQYLWGEYPAWVSVSTAFGMCMTILAATLYTFYFFAEQRHRVPILHRLLYAYIFVAAVSAVLVFFTPFTTTILLAIFVPTGGTVIIGLITLRLMMALDRDAVVYALAFTPIIFCGLVKGLHAMGTLPSNIFTVNSLQIGMGFAVLGLSLVLADRFNRERDERVRVSRLKRFFSPEVAGAITATGGEELLQPTRRYVVVVFTDMRGFTAFAAKTEPDEVLRVLREYHKVTTSTINRHHGTLEHFIGDGVMICFNTPVPVDNPEHKALNMVLDLHHQYQQLHEEWARCGHTLGIGIGMAAGEATVGVVGEDERQDYTTIGTVANLASRLCDLARHGEILVAGSLREKLADQVESQDIGKQFVKGIPDPLRIYKLLPAGSPDADA